MRMFKQQRPAKFVFAGLMAASMLAFAPILWAGGDVVHWWVGDAESKALKVIVDEFERGGGKWIDSPQNDSEAAHTSVKSRVIGGNPPAAVLMVVGSASQEWAEGGLLNDVDSVAKAENWDAVLPDGVASASKQNGKYIAAPVFISTVNWRYANLSVLQSAGVDEPMSWGAFMTSLPRIQKAGYVPIAVGGQDWQETLLFDHVALEREDHSTSGNCWMATWTPSIAMTPLGCSLPCGLWCRIPTRARPDGAGETPTTL